MDKVTAEVVSFYAGYDENGRLDGRPQARLERIRTLELLRELLPAAPASVLDVGGGPGAYARPLLAAGYQVRLVDIVASHVAQARPEVTGLVGDARSLPVPSFSFDATLLLGPLYHLLERSDRVQALREAVRVTRPGGRVVVAAISRFAAPLDFAVNGRLSGEILEETRRLVTDGMNNPATGFTHAYFHRVPELVAECTEAGLRDVVVHGVEGPAWIAAEAAETAEVFEGALELARLLSTEPETVPTSAHLLAVATTHR
ncbi:methyltransferase domain-containing protein [Actinoplanes sp. NPDC051861]|uniref:class I SAM-dependent methyltransferase n=1 Tax=Actinoplanes sp. NPDC051861 TaxID=3155170 RepID=UPI0034172605